MRWAADYARQPFMRLWAAMYRYDEHDRRLVEERARQFRGQVARRVSGELSEEEFRPLRLMNGLYLQLHAYMLRIAIPYGTLLSSKQLRMLAHITRTNTTSGYGHFTTRQNLQLNWVKLEDVPSILDELATVEMHAIQTSGNCVRNITSDHFAGVAPDEIVDPRPLAEILRQWSTFHPEFAYLPRKFKIAVTGSRHDRAAIAVHDIGLRGDERRERRGWLRVFVGGGQGRTPRIAERLREFVPERDLLAYTEAVLRVYNQLGRRDNIYKARIKILVKELGLERSGRGRGGVRRDQDGEGLVLDLGRGRDAIAKQFESPPPDIERFEMHAHLARAGKDDRRLRAGWRATSSRTARRATHRAALAEGHEAAPRATRLRRRWTLVAPSRSASAAASGAW